MSNKDNLNNNSHSNNNNNLGSQANYDQQYQNNNHQNNSNIITNTTIHIIMEIDKILIIIIKDTIKAPIVKIIHTVLIKKKRNDQNSFQ